MIQIAGTLGVTVQSVSRWVHEAQISRPENRPIWVGEFIPEIEVRKRLIADDYKQELRRWGGSYKYMPNQKRWQAICKLARKIERDGKVRTSLFDMENQDEWELFDKLQTERLDLNFG
jgi:hypothetical protein